MPKLGIVTTKKLFLPSTKDEPKEEDRAYVEVTEKLLAGVVVDIAGLQDDTERIIMCLANFIQDWNYTDDKDEKLPVNAENVRKLEPVDFSFLAEQFADAMNTTESGLSTNEKKASTASSTEAVTIPIQTSPQTSTPTDY